MRASVKLIQMPRHERIGEEQQEEARRRQHEPARRALAVCLQPLPGRGLADRGLDDGCTSTSAMSD